ncbi:MAG: gamma-glutamyltransferase family protein [Pseudomonadota bacterium]
MLPILATVYSSAVLSFDLPYPSRRAPVCADNLVATSQPLATQAGIDALRRGGNAVDAALCAAITLTVVEPCNNGVGSDAFAMIWDGARLHGLNASGRAPARMTLDRYTGRTVMPQFGWETVTVPGAVSAWGVLHERFGRLPFSSLFEAAIGYAENGFLVGPETAHIWAWAERAVGAQPGFADHFLPAPAPGQRVRRPELARTLQLIADQGPDVFYRGELAERMAAFAEQHDAPLERSDLADHQPLWVEPIDVPFRASRIHELPPNGQGLAALIALRILDRFDPGSTDDPATLHRALEAMKIAVRAAFDHVADPEHLRHAPAELLDDDNIGRLAKGIGNQAGVVPPALLPTSRDTVYLCAADESGLQISFIQSNYLAFGSGVVVPGTGIALQNRGAGFSLDPDHPNCVGPRKRPFHTIIPGFITANDAPRACLGVMGGHMQHQGHVQMATRLLDFGENPQAAIDAPRWQIEPDFQISLERGFPTALVADLEARGHRLTERRDYRHFGGAQMIYSTGDGLVGASDPRKEGQVSGF